MHTRTIWMVVSLLLLAVSLPAGTVDVNTAVGIWTDPTPVAGIVGVGTNKISWGTPAISSYEYATAAPIYGVNPGQIFQVGTFTHENYPIGQPLLESAVLEITLGMQIPGDGVPDGTNISKVFSYLFNHNETPNAPPCNPAGDPPCPDVVSILNPLASQTFMIDNLIYTLKIGFLDGQGQLVNQLITNENQDNQAFIYGVFTTEGVPQVPEPGTLLALGLGLSGIAMAVRRRQRS